MSQAVIEHTAFPQVTSRSATPAAITPMEMLATVATNGGSVEVVEKFMALAERWEANQARKAFDAAISAAKAEIPTIAKNATAHNNKRYANFAAIAAVVDPILSKHGLSYRFASEQGDNAIKVTCILSHKDGHSERTTLAGPADNSGGKNAIQAIGSTLTYLQRYSLVQMLGLATAEDDDGKTGFIGGPISDDDLVKLRALIDESGADIARFCRHFKIDALPDLPAARFAEAVASLNAKKAGAK